MVPRRLPLAIAALCGVATVVAAWALDASLPAPVVRPPPVAVDGSTGPSLLAILLRLLADLFGLRLTGAAGAGGPSTLPFVAASLAVLTGLAVCLAVVVLLVRRTEGDRGGRPERQSADPAAAPSWSPTPHTAVDRVWLALLDRLDATRPHALTTGEWERRAVEAGYDPDHVGRLRRAVDRTHYADRAASDSRALARRCRRRLGLGTDASGSAEPTRDGLEPTPSDSDDGTDR
jgi:hypothetical protein